MSKKQTRRSISVRGTTYVQLRDWCEAENVSMSDFVEQRVTEFFGEKPAAVNRLTGMKGVEKPSVTRVAEKASAAKVVEKVAAAKVVEKVAAAKVVEKVSVQRAPLVIERPAPARVVAARIEAPPPREVPSKSAVINRPMPTAVLRAATPAPLPQKAIAPPVVAAVAARPATRNPASTPPSKVLKVLKARDEGAGDHDVDYRAIRF